MNASTSDPTQRTIFFEGQIVAAADLNQAVEHARGAQARHERYLHLPGIAEGLELTKTERQTAEGQPYVQVTMGPGLATDGTGRQLLAIEPERLGEDLFDQLNVAINDPEAYYPVFLTGRDETPAASDAPLVACARGAPTRVLEVTEVTFGRVEDAADPGNPTVDDIGSGPGGDGSTNPWRVLLGFVKWDAGISRFSDVKDSHDGVGRLYAGVKADEVVARGGVLALRTAAKGADGTPVVEIDGSADGELRFGLQNSAGAVVPVLTVNAKGDLHAEGKITGAIAGGVQILTGSVSDGALVPLMKGVTQDKIDSGDFSIQVSVTPRFGQPALSIPAAAPNNTLWLMRPIECRVDGRRVFCSVHWEAVAPNGTVHARQRLPGVADFTLIVLGAA